jgi:hypothetical protein
LRFTLAQIPNFFDSTLAIGGEVCSTKYERNGAKSDPEGKLCSIGIVKTNAESTKRDRGSPECVSTLIRPTTELVEGAGDAGRRDLVSRAAHGQSRVAGMGSGQKQPYGNYDRLLRAIPY